MPPNATMPTGTHKTRHCHLAILAGEARHRPFVSPIVLLIGSRHTLTWQQFLRPVSHYADGCSGVPCVVNACQCRLCAQETRDAHRLVEEVAIVAHRARRRCKCLRTTSYRAGRSTNRASAQCGRWAMCAVRPLGYVRTDDGALRIVDDLLAAVGTPPVIRRAAFDAGRINEGAAVPLLPGDGLCGRCGARHT